MTTSKTLRAWNFYLHYIPTYTHHYTGTLIERSSHFFSNLLRCIPLCRSEESSKTPQLFAATSDHYGEIFDEQVTKLSKGKNSRLRNRNNSYNNNNSGNNYQNMSPLICEREALWRSESARLPAANHSLPWIRLKLKWMTADAHRYAVI